MAISAKQRAVVIGSGPNGLGAAIVLARAGCAVTVFEGAEKIGGGTRSAELTLPGFVHDVCSAIHPMGVTSPCFEEFGLTSHGLEWIHPDAPLAHPLDDGTAVVLERSMVETAKGLGADGAAWVGVFDPLVRNWDGLRHDILAPLGIPKHPLQMASFGMRAMRSARGLAEATFKGERARALFIGIAAHAVMPLDEPFSAAIGLVLGAIGHAAGWPVARGGSQSIADALARCLQSYGGEIVTGNTVCELPDAQIVMGDITPRQMLKIAGSRFDAGFRSALERYRYGAGAFKIDWALDGPIPWRARECARAGTVHLGGSLEEMVEWEREYRGRPFVLIAQQSLFDDTRAPRGKHTAWGYCHIPNGSTRDMTVEIEDQIERFAPGFRACIIGRAVRGPAEMERYNPNLIGGDFQGGAMSASQIFLRPTWRRYGTPVKGLYFCGASTPPGGAVHGMCGYHAARAALR